MKVNFPVLSRKEFKLRPLTSKYIPCAAQYD